MMREDWNDRAKDNPLYWTYATEGRERFTTVKPYFDAGEVEFKEMILPHLGGGRDIAVDFGCGVGRLTFPLARHYDTVYGYDISPEMIKMAGKYTTKSRCPKGNVRFNVSSGGLQIGDSRADLTLCIGVLQHIPDPATRLGTLAELIMATKFDGKIIFNFNPHVEQAAHIKEQWARREKAQDLMGWSESAGAELVDGRWKTWMAHADDPDTLYDWVEQQGAAPYHYETFKGFHWVVATKIT